MKMKQCLAAQDYSLYTNLALLLVRLVMGYAFIMHGSMKIQDPFHWMPDSPIPGFLLALAALAEFGGGIALILGLLTRIAALGMAITMAVAVSMHAFMFGDSFVNLTGGRSFELPAIFLVVAILFVAMGPGGLSVDRKVFGTK